MMIETLKPAAVHAGRRAGAYLLMSGVLAIGALAWATDGFRAIPSWSDIREWRDGEIVLDIPSPDQSFPVDYETKD